MAKKKLYKTDMSMEELLALAGAVAQEDPEVDEFETFLEFMNTEKSDTDIVRHFIIYWFYLQWKERGNGLDTPPMRYYDFYRRLNMKFENGYHADGYVRVKKDPYQVDAKLVKQIKKERKSWDRSRKGTKLKLQD